MDNAAIATITNIVIITTINVMSTPLLFHTIVEWCHYNHHHHYNDHHQQQQQQADDQRWKRSWRSKCNGSCLRKKVSSSFIHTVINYKYWQQSNIIRVIIYTNCHLRYLLNKYKYMIIEFITRQIHPHPDQNHHEKLIMQVSFHIILYHTVVHLPTAAVMWTIV